MIVLSAGMQKSGSAYLYNIINDIVKSSGGQDARDIKEKHGLSGSLQWYNNNIGETSRKNLRPLIRLSLTIGPFVIKTHEPPTRYVSRKLRRNQLKVIYVYRDPRDVLMSAIDHGNKILSEGETHTFAKMTEFQSAFKNVKNWIEIYKSYKALKNCLCIRYEDLMGNGLNEVKKICEYLDMRKSDDQLVEILSRYDKSNPNAEMKGMHFNKAITFRYKDEMPEDQLTYFKSELGAELKEMGYAV